MAAGSLAEGEAYALARRIAQRLGEIRGVAGVVLGGSRARGVARPDSDIDLGIYYRPAEPIDIPALQALAGELGRGDVTQTGEWGPWVNGGGWLDIDSTNVDWLYRDLELLERVLADTRAGKFTSHYYLGLTHAYHSYNYIGDLVTCVPLHDPTGVLARLQAEALPYPQPLKHEIVRRFLYDARFTLENARKPAARGDALLVTGGLFRIVACLVQVVFALNETYFAGEKGAVALAATMSASPPAFRTRAEAILALAPRDAGAAIRTAERLIVEVETLAREQDIPLSVIASPHLAVEPSL